MLVRCMIRTSGRNIGIARVANINIRMVFIYFSGMKGAAITITTRMVWLYCVVWKSEILTLRCCVFRAVRQGGPQIICVVGKIY